jgi:hypothetical protein
MYVKKQIPKELDGRRVDDGLIEWINGEYSKGYEFCCLLNTQSKAYDCAIFKRKGTDEK